MSLLGASFSNEVDSKEVRPSFAVSPIAIFVCLAISALSFLIMFLFGSTLKIPKEWLAIFGLVVGGAMLIMVACKLLFEDWIDTDRQLLIHSFSCRDRRGRTGLSRRLRLGLTLMPRWGRVQHTGSLRDNLDQQPIEYLFGLAASDILRRRHEINDSLGTDLLTLLRNQPDCLVSTRINLIENPSPALRAAALDVMPRDLWPRARRKLLRSDHAEARIAAVRCISDRHALMRVCRTDRAEPVRLEAWEQLSAHLAKSEALFLIRSPHADVRLLVLKSRTLPRELEVKVCQTDKDETVRTLAWNLIQKRLTKTEAVSLYASPFVGINLCAVRSGKLSIPLLKKICFKDPVETIRLAAWEQIQHQVDGDCAAYLVRSQHVDTRIRAVQSRQLRRELLLKVGIKDQERRVRMETFEQIKAGLTAAEATTLSNSLDDEFRSHAVESDLLLRKRLLQLCRGDTEWAVRRAAWPKVQKELTGKEATYLSRSQHKDVRLLALRSGKLSNWRSRKLSRERLI